MIQGVNVRLSKAHIAGVGRGMAKQRPLGRRFGWLWASYAVSTLGTWLAFDAFSLVAILALHSGPGEVSLLAAAGLAVGALVAVPLGPWMEARRRRPVMIAMDLARFAALISIPLAYLLGSLTFAQLLIVSVLVAAAGIAFKAASGAYLKALVGPEDLLVASARLESTTWTATMLGPPLGGAAIGLFGPVITMLADAVSYLLSALGLRAIGGGERHPGELAGPHPAGAAAAHAGRAAEAHPGGAGEPKPSRAPAARMRGRDLVEGWRHILASRALRPLFFNTTLVSSLIMATSPLIAVLMLGRLGFAPWQYGLAFAAPCAGGLIGSRLAPRLVSRFGRHRVIRIVGTLRACWSIGLAFIIPGVGGLLLVMGVQLGLVTCMGIFNPVFAAYRLDQTADDRVARTLSAWTVTSRMSVAALTALWGLLAAVTSLRVAIAIAGALMLLTPMLLPLRVHVVALEPEPVLGDA